MGCSPSKGQLFAGVSAHKALQLGSQESNNDFVSDGTEIQRETETDIISTELNKFEDDNTLAPLQGKESSLSDVVCDTAAINKEGDDVEKNEDSQEGLLPQDKAEKNNESKKNKGAKKRKQKEMMRKTVNIRTKVNFPEKIVNAHQAAYSYLNPNISKYETLLGLLDQATKTHLSLQPLVALLAVHYEELIQALEEMAVEGEQMLEEHGNHMVCPAAFSDALFSPTKSDAELYSHKPSPYRLQQMLQHSTENMRLVGDTVKGLGDAALEEAADYFASLSQLLGEKLVMKRAAERRLKQVLDYVEAAALRKPGLEDSALHSEDSGIGADNECQNGSVRLRSQRGSSGSGASSDLSSGCPENTLPSQPRLNGVDEDIHDEDDDEDDNEENNDDEDSSEDYEEAKDEHKRNTAITERKMSNCSQADPCAYSVQASLQNGQPVSRFLKSANWRNVKIRQAKTAENSSVTSQRNPRHSCSMGLRRAQSSDCLYSKADDCTVKDQERSHWDNQRAECIGKGLTGSVRLDSFSRTRLRRHSLEGHNISRCSDLQYRSKRLFKATVPPSSPSAFAPVPPGRNAVKRLINTFSQGVQDKSNQKPIKVKGTNKSFLPILSNSKGGVSTNGNNNNNSYSVDQRPEDVDVDNLPPPPPEVLMDNSFESNEGPCDEESTQRCSTQRQKCGVSRLRSSLQTGAVLPSRPIVPRRTHSISPARPIRQDAVVGSRPGYVSHQETDVNADNKEAISLYKASHSPAKTDITRAESIGRQGNRDTGENALSPHPNSYPPTTPPVSRARLPPSCPSVCYRIPSPPALPSSLACKQWGPSATTSTPRTQRWIRICSDEENATSSRSFHDARSVFCQDPQTGSQSLTPSCRSTLPRPWGEPSRGRLQTRLPPTVKKNTSLSPLRSPLTDQYQPLHSATQCHNQENERRDSNSLCEAAKENPESCYVTDHHNSQGVAGAEEAEPKQIVDNQD